MNELDIENMKEKYIEYKEKHYEDETEIRKLIKIKNIVPSIEDDIEWKKSYEKVNNNLSDGIYYYNELKKMLSEKELREFTDNVKNNNMKKRYISLRLDKLEKKEKKFTGNLEELKMITMLENFDKSCFAKSILSENDLNEKVKIVCKFKKYSSFDVFFDTTAILKAEFARMFIDNMNIGDVDRNKVITACLVYAFKRTNTPKEIERIKNEKEKDKEFLKELGFDDNFCKICSEYNRYNEKEDYIRENEGDILELVDKFVGLIMHREDRTAFPVDVALETLEFKELEDVENKYLKKFKTFINSTEQIEITRFVGIITYYANCVNSNKRSDIASILKTISDVRELTGDFVSKQNVLKMEKAEKIQEKSSISQYLEEDIERVKDKISSLSKILRGYKKMS